MRTCTAFVAVAALLVCACGRGGPASADRREFKLQGQIISVSADHKDVVIKHEDIAGFMSAMTMSYHAREVKELAPLAPGDLINATLVVEARDAFIQSVKKVGEAPLERAPGSGATAGMNILPAGAPVPSVPLVDSNGKAVSLESFRGSAVVVTFTYTSCPMPNQCPLLDRHFVAIQKKLQVEGNRLRAHLLTVTIDPARDTPAALKAYAAQLGADPALWTFATGTQQVVDEWASRFGVSVSRASKVPSDITHNLRTAIIDRQGNLVRTYSGSEWTPEQLLGDVKAMVAVD